VVSSLSFVRLFRPRGLQPAKLLCPWDFPGKNIGVGCHFLPQYICIRMYICIKRMYIYGKEFLPAMQEMPVRFLGQEDPLENG